MSVVIRDVRIRMSDAAKIYRLRRVGLPATIGKIRDVYELTKDVCRIGRHSASDFYLDSAQLHFYISRWHAEIHCLNEQGFPSYVIRDISLNGTYVNDRRVDTNEILQEGDIVTFGHKNGKHIAPGELEPQGPSEFQFVFESCSGKEESTAADSGLLHEHHVADTTSGITSKHEPQTLFPVNTDNNNARVCLESVIPMPVFVCLSKLEGEQEQLSVPTGMVPVPVSVPQQMASLVGQQGQVSPGATGLLPVCVLPEMGALVTPQEQISAGTTGFLPIAFPHQIGALQATEEEQVSLVKANQMSAALAPQNTSPSATQQEQISSVPTGFLQASFPQEKDTLITSEEYITPEQPQLTPVSTAHGFSNLVFQQPQTPVRSPGHLTGDSAECGSRAAVHHTPEPSSPELPGSCPNSPSVPGSPHIEPPWELPDVLSSGNVTGTEDNITPETAEFQSFVSLQDITNVRNPRHYLVQPTGQREDAEQRDPTSVRNCFKPLAPVAPRDAAKPCTSAANDCSPGRNTTQGGNPLSTCQPMPVSGQPHEQSLLAVYLTSSTPCEESVTGDSSDVPLSVMKEMSTPLAAGRPEGKKRKKSGVKRVGKGSKQGAKKRTSSTSDSSMLYHSDGDQCDAIDCDSPTGSKVSWVQCDDCDKWFHTSCAGCSYSLVRQQNTEFHCGCA